MIPFSFQVDLRDLIVSHLDDLLGASVPFPSSTDYCTAGSLRNEQVITSPSRATNDGLRHNIKTGPLAFWMTCAPLSLDSQTHAGVDVGTILGVDGFDKCCEETEMYKHLTLFVPPENVVHAVRTGKGGVSAKTMFNRTTFSTPNGIVMSGRMFPEIDVRPTQPVARFVGEAKTVDCIMWEQLAQYGIVSLFTLFPQGSPALRFYTRPPIAFGIACAGCTGFLVCIEWIGVAMCSIISEPFFISSSSHKNAVSALPHISYDNNFVEIVEDEHTFVRHSIMAPHQLVRWTPTAMNGNFYKIIAANAFACFTSTNHPNSFLIIEHPSPFFNFFDLSFLEGVSTTDPDQASAAYWKHLYLVYAKLGAIPENEFPPALRQCQLLYGQFEVCVQMQFVEGRDATKTDLMDEQIANELIDALLWLGSHCMLYTDLRLPNFRIVGEDVTTGGMNSSSSSSHRIVLIDYDDMALLSKPVNDAAVLLNLLNANTHWRRGLDAVPTVRTVLQQRAAQEVGNASVCVGTGDKEGAGAGTSSS